MCNGFIRAGVGDPVGGARRGEEEAVYLSKQKALKDFLTCFLI